MKSWLWRGSTSIVQAHRTSPSLWDCRASPHHPRVKEFEAEVAARVHAAGKKMTSDVLVAVGAARLFLDGARAFLESEGTA